MKKQTVFNTVQDMVDWSVANHYYAGRKWTLSDRTERVWDDKEVGAKWDADYSAVADILWDARYSKADQYTDEDRAEMEAKLEEYRKVKPSQHLETDYWLTEVRSGWGSKDSITLSAELGAMVAKIWTMVPSYRGSSSLKYSPAGLSVLGILKRLGNTDVAGAVADAKARREALDRKNSRNYYRREAEKQAKELIETMKKGLAEGVVFPVHLSELTDMGKYMEE